MNDNASKNILDFYIKANENKEKITNIKTDNRRYSVAEVVSMSCIDEVIKDKNKYTNINIRQLLLRSLTGKMGNLRRNEEYSNFLANDDMYLVYGERYLDNVCNMYKDSKKLYDNYTKLQSIIRKGHIYWGAKGERLESILEHIYGCMVLAIGFESEYDLDLDYDKILRMLLVHETEEVTIGDLTDWDISKEEKSKLGRKAVLDLIEGTRNKEEIISLIDEFNNKETKESKYANLIDKLEYDMQVKIYDLKQKYDYNNIPSNVVTDSEVVRNIMNNGAQSVFDVHYEYDKHKYDNYNDFKLILEETKKYRK